MKKVLVSKSGDSCYLPIGQMSIRPMTSQAKKFFPTHPPLEGVSVLPSSLKDVRIIIIIHMESKKAGG
jgi:hypothetical protein